MTHVYLSPILQANPGSPHGYDVVDHSRVSTDLGGEPAFREMADEFHRHGLGVVVDVVPNHMARPTPESLNKQLWSVLYQGRQSEFAHWFDVDWDAQEGKLLMPILAGPLEECLGDLIIDTAPRNPENAGHRGPVLRYFDHVLPLRDGVADLPLGVLLAQQHYRLTDARDAATQLNWRRFFDVDELIAIRVEDPDVFAATHQVLLRLLREGLIDGLRVDHPDGLADPRGYLARLATETGGAWVVVEKILAHGEELPDWPCAGTTGYDTLALVGGLFTDPAGDVPLTEEYVRFTGGKQSFAEVERDAKHDIADGTFAAELSRLTRLFARAGYPALDGFTAADLHDVLVAVLAEFGVYRAYVTPGEPPSAAAAAAVTAAAAAARDHLDEHLHPALDAVRGGRARPGRGDRRRGPAGRAGRADRAVRPDHRPGAGQGGGGHRVLPLVAAGRAERGGRQPGHLRHQPGRVPRRRRPPRPALAVHLDHAVHARHQTAGRRPGPAGRAGRMAAGVGTPGGRVARPGQVAHRRRRGARPRSGPRSPILST